MAEWHSAAIQTRDQRSPVWCKVVTLPRGRQMSEKRSQGKSPKAQKKAAVRASITFPPDLYENLEDIAKQKKVSLAWVVRDASEKYVASAEKEQARRI